jgi:hypothetical protein
VAASLLWLVCAVAARAGDGATISADTSWQKIDDKDGVTLYNRKRVGSSVKEFKGTGIIDATVAQVEKVLRDVPSYTSFMPYVTEARIISDSVDETVCYERLDPPMVSNRDYTVRVQHGSWRSATGLLTIRDTWQAANDAGPAERHGVVRVNVDEGCWLLEPVGPGGATTQATYQIYTDSGGALPVFVANKACQEAILKLFGAIRKQAQDPKYQTP